jgi:hypothetical protein
MTLIGAEGAQEAVHRIVDMVLDRGLVALHRQADADPHVDAAANERDELLGGDRGVGAAQASGAHLLAIQPEKKARKCAGPLS